MSEPSVLTLARWYADERGLKDGDLVDVTAEVGSRTLVLRHVVRVVDELPAEGEAAFEPDDGADLREAEA